MRHRKGLFAALPLAFLVIGLGSTIRASADPPAGRPTFIFDLLIGSWLVTYDVQAFGLRATGS
jgi:hypothetical protein